LRGGCSGILVQDCAGAAERRRHPQRVVGR
jgi:hypothetical protein